MTILTIDIGNTKTKIAIFQDNILVQHNVLNRVNQSDIIAINAQFPSVDIVMLSSVNKEEETRLINVLNKYSITVHTITHISPLPFEIDYETPETLGSDRIAAMTGAYAIQGINDYLIIDIGTCITYDVIVNNHFIGGNIAPGLQMRLDALHEHTASLPYIELTKPTNELGRSTKQAILNGVYWGVQNEIKGVISRYRERYDGIKVIITGGGTNYCEKDPEVIYEPMLVSKGLNFLAYNLSK